jgi:DNA (cytosine-5)-methyltransferase 1
MFRVYDLFCGAGGFSRGFVDEDFEVVGAIDNFPPVAETYRYNFPNTTLIVEDIKNIHPIDFLGFIGKEPDVIIGSPPCEPFTAANIKRLENPLDRLYKDPIGRLTLSFIRFVGDLRPKVFVMENVPQIIEGPLKDAIKKEFERVGYSKIYFNLLRAERYGNPSRRSRLFISNIKLSPKPVKKKVTVIEAIGDLPDPEGVHDVPNHEWHPIPRRKRKKIASLRWGESLIFYRGARGKIFTNWTRLHPYRVAPTVLGNSRFIHPFEDRFLTVREHARLMSFPDDHVFFGGRSVQYEEVGEAVPVVLARVIACEVKKFLVEKSSE